MLFLSTTLYRYALSLSLSLSLSHFSKHWFVALSLSIPIFKHGSPLPLGPISTPSRLDLLYLCSTFKPPQASSLPQALTHNDRCICRELFQSTHKHRSLLPTLIHKHPNPFQSTHKLWSSATGTDPPIHKWSTLASICLFVGLFVWVCSCISMLICLCGCVYVWMCLSVSEEKEDEERRSHWVCCARRKERKKRCKCEINKIIEYTFTVTVHICTVIVAHV